MRPTLPNVFRISFSETTLCLAPLSLLSMPFKNVHHGDRTALQGGPVGSDHSSHLTFTLARSVLSAVACDCLWLSVRLHVSFPSSPRLRCIPNLLLNQGPQRHSQVLAWSSLSTDSEDRTTATRAIK